MPKQIDASTRRLEVVDAVFRVVMRGGLERASLRTVADEAGLNIGSVRHYFTSQQELMRFAMQAMLDRVSARLLRRIDELGDVSALPPTRQRQRAADVLAELLPLDEERHAEVTVFIDFVTAARTNATFADLAAKAALGTRALVRQTLTRLQQTAGIRPDLDLDTETERLTALMDGLGLNAILHPELVGADTCDAVLRAHLDSLRPARR
ncbi:TetR/AcrR family transcriptional regulator [Dactylosporangium sp. NPDC000555]|uniref:TetR/AcrR family transcriptional regulator n=1 Tax=Dactylosporangium sp. NPDC000555 TaxID=3154260 RepID=UPI003328416C